MVTEKPQIGKKHHEMGKSAEFQGRGRKPIALPCNCQLQARDTWSSYCPVAWVSKARKHPHKPALKRHKLPEKSWTLDLQRLSAGGGMQTLITAHSCAQGERECFPNKSSPMAARGRGGSDPFPGPRPAIRLIIKHRAVLCTPAPSIHHPIFSLQSVSDAS